MKLERIVPVLLVVWSAATLFSEGLQQACLYATLLLALWGVASRRLTLERELRPLLLVTLALTLWQFASPLFAPSFPRASRYTQAFDTLAPLAVCLVAMVGIPWRTIFWVVGLGWLGETLIALFQSLVRWPLDRIGPWNLTAHVSRAWENFAPPGAPPRYPGVGLYFHRLRYAHAAVALLGPALALLLRRRVLVALFVVAFTLAAPILAYTRAALVAGAVMLVAGLLFSLKGRKRLLLIGAMGLGTAVLLLSAPVRSHLRLQDPLSHFVDEGARAVAVRTGLRIIRAHPAIGVGFGNYQPVVRALVDNPDQAALQADPNLTMSPHNLWLMTWAETGIPGLLLLAAFHLLLARALLRKARAGSEFALGGLLSWIGFQVLNLVHYTPQHSGVQLTFALVWGLALAPTFPAPTAPRRPAKD